MQFTWYKSRDHSKPLHLKVDAYKQISSRQILVFTMPAKKKINSVAKANQRGAKKSR